MRRLLVHLSPMIRHLLLAAFLLTCTVAASPGASPQAAPADPSAAAAGLTLTQNDAVVMALRQNPTLEMARRERNVGLIEADRNRPVFRPEVSATADQVLRAPRKDLPGLPDAAVLPNSISRLQIEVRQQIFQFGAGGAPGKRAGAMAAAAESDYRKAVLDTALQVREAYLNLLRAQRVIDVARQAVELARASTELTRLQKERGFQADVDLLQAEKSQAEAESRLLQAQNGVALARANVNRLVGRPIDAELTAANPGELPGEPPALQDLVPRAVAQRPEAETLRQNIRAADAGVRLAKAARSPRVDLEAAYALRTPTALFPQNDVSAGVRLTAPIFNGAAGSFTVREAEERQAQLVSALVALEQGIALEIQQQRLAMEEARARMAVADRTVATSDKVYQITRLKLERGLAVQLELATARLDLERALTDRVQAEADLRLARVRLDRALGQDPAVETGDALHARREKRKELRAPSGAERRVADEHDRDDPYDDRDEQD